jgi:2-dehydropantoate 2-reductase
MNAVEKPMRIAIVAPGGVGGYFGGMPVKAGGDVAAVARGAHLVAIRQSGLRVEGPGGDDTISMDASDNAADLGIVDVVLFAAALFGPRPSAFHC